MTKTIQLNSLDEKLDAVAAAAKSVLFELEWLATKPARPASNSGTPSWLTCSTRCEISFSPPPSLASDVRHSPH
jgi:hypothetical protein